MPLASFDDVPSISREFEHKQEKEARNKRKTARLQRETSLHGVKQEVTDVAELHPLIRVEDTDDYPGHHAVSDSTRYMSGCPMTVFMNVKSVLGSGATDSCTPDCMCPWVKNRPSEGSRRGQMKTSAGGKKIANQGEKDITMVTGANEVVQTSWQTVDIRPNSSVTQILLQGNRVLFGAQGGVIYNSESGQETPFCIEDNVYALDLWLSPSLERGFGRQGLVTRLWMALL